MKDFVPLRLKAKDHDDLFIFSALLQEGLIPFLSMSFNGATGSFTCLVNRFCWEHAEPFYRVHAALLFSNVKKVHHRNFGEMHPGRIFNLLVISWKEDTACVHLLFSEDRELRLETSALDCSLNDREEPWITSHRPLFSE